MSAPPHWTPELLALRQRSAVIVSVPTRDDLTAEVYADTREEAVAVLMGRDWGRDELVWAAGVRGLDVPHRASKRQLAEALVDAGPAFFGQTPRVPEEDLDDVPADRRSGQVTSPPPRGAGTGPYNTKQQALAEPMPRAVSVVITGPYHSSSDAARVHNIVLNAITDACEQSGVTLGTFDQQTLEFGLARLDRGTVQVVIGLIRRAYDAGWQAATEQDGG